MVEGAILTGSVAVLAVALLSGRLHRSLITAPMLVMGLGFAGSELLGAEMAPQGGLTLFLELTLALVLFSDASRIDLMMLRDEHRWPQRMLLIGLPLAILLGAASAGWILGLGWGPALLVAVILAPTDAALAEPVLTTESLPTRIRRAVNVESGLNDGLALPALFIALAFSDTGELGLFDAVALIARQLGFGVGIGVGVGLLAAWLFRVGIERAWISPAYQKIGIVALALGTFAVTQLVGGSGFVATFVAGMVFAANCRRTGVSLFEFAENEASTLVLIAFLVFGASQVTGLLRSPPPLEVWALALISLVVVRPVAVAISLIGQRVSTPTRLFFGWFGPRGLASIVFLLTAMEELPQLPAVVTEVVVATVVLSVLLHGASAYPASAGLARTLHRMKGEAMPEMEEVSMIPPRMIGLNKPSPR